MIEKYYVSPTLFQDSPLNSHSLTRFEAGNLVDSYLLPEKEYGKRTRLSRTTSQNEDNGNNSIPPQAIRASDPSTSFTYGEFPFESLDMLIDVSLQCCEQQGKSSSPFCFLDLGSGCARLCLYLALSRPCWEIHGIEAMESLHGEASRAVQLGIDNGWFVADKKNLDDSTMTTTSSSLHLHCGLAHEFPDILQKADIIFMYSTAMQMGPFLPDVQGVLLSDEWNDLLSRHCRPGTILVTTDRVLNPSLGWELLDRIDVPNPEVLGSTGFIQRKS